MNDDSYYSFPNSPGMDHHDTEKAKDPIGNGFPGWRDASDDDGSDPGTLLSPPVPAKDNESERNKRIGAGMPWSDHGFKWDAAQQPGSPAERALRSSIEMMGPEDRSMLARSIEVDGRSLKIEAFVNAGSDPDAPALALIDGSGKTAGSLRAVQRRGDVQVFKATTEAGYSFIAIGPDGSTTEYRSLDDIAR